MITGHFGVAAIAQSTLREPLRPLHLFLLFGASVAPDAVDVLYWLFGICSPYGLYSHTLHAVLLQAAVIGGVAFLVSGSWRMALLFVAVVLLHMPGDWITGQKLFAPGAEMMGLRLYDRPLWDWLLELPILLLGWLMLRRARTGPAWATSVYTLLFMMLVQTGFDLHGAATGRGVKPNACPRVEPPAVTTLVSAARSRHVGASATPRPIHTRSIQ